MEVFMDIKHGDKLINIYIIFMGEMLFKCMHCYNVI